MNLSVGSFQLFTGPSLYRNVPGADPRAATLRVSTSLARAKCVPDRSNRGEVTLVLEGAPDHAVELTPTELVRLVGVREAAGLTRKEALSAVASETGVAKREVYDAVVAAKAVP